MPWRAADIRLWEEAGRDAVTYMGTLEGVDPARVAVVPHGAFDYLTRLEPAPLPEPLAGPGEIVAVTGVDVAAARCRVAVLRLEVVHDHREAAILLL